jgi:hypothetical protein
VNNELNLLSVTEKGKVWPRNVTAHHSAGTLLYFTLPTAATPPTGKNTGCMCVCIYIYICYNALWRSML